MFQRLRDQLFGSSTGAGSGFEGWASSTGGRADDIRRKEHRPHHSSSSSTSVLPVSQRDGLPRAVTPHLRHQQGSRALTRPTSAVSLEGLASGHSDMHVAQRRGDGVGSDRSATGLHGMRRASSSMDFFSAHLGGASHPPTSVPPAREVERRAGATPSPSSASPGDFFVASSAGTPSASPKKYSLPAEAPFQSAMACEPVDMRRLREMSWHGCPVRVRRDVWCLLTGHWHPQQSQRESIVARKRGEYLSYVERLYARVDWDAVCAVVDGGGADSAALRWRREDTQQQRPTHRGAGTAGSQGVARHRGLRLSASAQSLLLSSHSPAAPQLSTGPHRSHRAASVADDVEDSERQVASSSSSRSRHTGQGTGSVGVHGTGTPDEAPQPAVVAPVARLSTGSLAASSEVQIVKQIRKDIPRMSRGVAWLQHPRVRATMERILFIWSLRHPACGYVQGMNDFVVPFLAVVLAHRYCATKSVSELYSFDEGMVNEKFGPACQEFNSRGDADRVVAPATTVEQAPPCEGIVHNHPMDAATEDLAAEGAESASISSYEEMKTGDRGSVDGVSALTQLPAAPTDDTFVAKPVVDTDAVWNGELEADTYWLTSYVLSVMQDNYTRQQSGITAMVRRLEAVLAAADAALYKHLTQELNIEISLFAFRWINCLLLRELSVTQSLRLFDAYLSDENRDWSTSHVFVCCAVLLRMSGLLMGIKDFALALHTLQNPPTDRLSSKDMNEVISEAYILQCLYASVPPVNSSGHDGSQPTASSSSAAARGTATYVPARFTPSWRQ